MNVYIETHGCKLNIADSQKISKGILSKGFSISDDLEKSDIYILNTLPSEININSIIVQLPSLLIKKQETD